MREPEAVEFLTMALEDTYEEMSQLVNLTADLREIFFGDCGEEEQAEMIGSPESVLRYAIERMKQLKKENEQYRKSYEIYLKSRDDWK